MIARIASFILVAWLLVPCAADGPVVTAAPPITPQTKVTDIAELAVDVIVSKDPGWLDNYLILMCTSDREDSLAKDSDIGAFVRGMKAAKSNLAAIVMPAGGGSDPTFVVYFDTATPLGFVRFDPRTGKPTDQFVRTAYERLSGTTPKARRKPKLEAGVIQADDGTDIYALKIVGWE